MELIYEVRDAEEGGYTARALGQSIHTQGDTWEDLKANVLEATDVHYEGSDEQRPKAVRLHYIKDELIAFEAA